MAGSSSRARAGGMAPRSLLLLAAAAVLILAPHGAAQPSPAPSGSAGGSCVAEIVSLTPCLGYMSGNASKPSSACCSSLSNVVASSPRCLCTVLGGGASSLGVTINTTRALELPGACDVKTPPASLCKSVGVPVPSPPATPATPSTTPASPAAGSGAKATQTSQSSGGRSGAGEAASSVLPVAAAAAVFSAVFALLQL